MFRFLSNHQVISFKISANACFFLLHVWRGGVARCWRHIMVSRAGDVIVFASLVLCHDQKRLPFFVRKTLFGDPPILSSCIESHCVKVENFFYPNTATHLVLLVMPRGQAACESGKHFTVVFRSKRIIFIEVTLCIG